MIIKSKYGNSMITKLWLHVPYAPLGMLMDPWVLQTRVNPCCIALWPFRSIRSILLFSSNNWFLGETSWQAPLGCVLYHGFPGEFLRKARRLYKETKMATASFSFAGVVHKRMSILCPYISARLMLETVSWVTTPRNWKNTYKLRKCARVNWGFWSSQSTALLLSSSYVK